MVISRKRLNSLKQIKDPQKFFDALLCDIPSLVEEHREVFEANARHYDKKRREYKTVCDKEINWTAVEAAKTKARQEGGRIHCTTLDKSPEPPKDGWELTETQITKDDLSFGWYFWKPPDFPSNPDNWFRTYNPQYPRERVKIRGDEEEFFQRQITIETITITPKESVLRDYGVIAALYNQYAKNAGETPIEPEILSNVEIRQHYETPMDRHHIWPDVKKYLIKSLKAVNRDLASEKKGAGTNAATMPRRFKKADDSYKEAMAMATKGGTELRTEEQVYDWLSNNGCSQYDDNGLPDFETWERYLRGARKYRMKQQATALKSVPNIPR